MKVYSIKDKLMGFTGPICFKDDKNATRWFDSFCRRKKAEEYTEPKYYELYEIGEFDEKKGVIKGYELAELKLIMEGGSFNEPENN